VAGADGDSGGAAIVLNAANEVAVDAFLGGRIRFTDIARHVADTLEASDDLPPTSIADVVEIDRATRSRVQAAVAEVYS